MSGVCSPQLDPSIGIRFVRLCPRRCPCTRAVPLKPKQHGSFALAAFSATALPSTAPACRLQPLARHPAARRAGDCSVFAPPSPRPQQLYPWTRFHPCSLAVRTETRVNFSESRGGDVQSAEFTVKILTADYLCPASSGRGCNASHNTRCGEEPAWTSRDGGACT